MLAIFQFLYKSFSYASFDFHLIDFTVWNLFVSLFRFYIFDSICAFVLESLIFIRDNAEGKPDTRIEL